MRDYTVRTGDQLASLLRSFRSSRQKRQAELATQLATRQQDISRLEQDPTAISVGRLMKLLAALEVDLVLRDRKQSPGDAATPAEEPW
jgi:HTH-type transcriptional regulator / antitoxin HipB